MKESAVDLLVEEALRITNNLVDEIEEDEKGVEAKTEGWFSRRRKWRPAGRIRVWDTEVGDFIGVEGVKVRVRRWFRVTRAFTDSNGNFRCGGRFRGKARYRMDWERYHFALRSGFWASAQRRGPWTRNSNWNWDIGNGDRHQYFAHVFQGAYDYYYGHRFGLTSPKRKSFWRSQVKIRASRGNGRASHHSGRGTFGLLDDIIIYAYGKGSDEMYGVSVHELAHSAHRVVDRWDYDKLVKKGYTSPANWWKDIDELSQKAISARRLLETWATTVEVEFVYERYRNTLDLGDDYIEYVDDPRRLFTLSNENTRIYTSAGLDMLDNENQREVSGGDPRHTQDRVSGYTIKQLENSLRNATSFGEWRDKLRMEHTNSTSGFVNELFENWGN